MKANIYFDGDKYKFYYGDAQIVTDSLTINEIAIDSQLSNTSKNAVQNCLVKNALDEHTRKIKTVNERINTLLDSSTFDYKEIVPSGWTWNDDSGESVVFTLPKNSLVVVRYIEGVTGEINLKSGDIYISTLTIGINTAWTNYVYTLINTLDYADFKVVCAGVEHNQRKYIEGAMRFYVLGIPNELKDIRVDYLGVTHPTAGDAVRSILNVIQNGNLSLVDSLKWLGEPTKLFKSMCSSDEIVMAKDQTIQVVLPPLTALQIINISAEPQESQQIGDITATSQQDLNVTLKTGNTYKFSIASNNEEFNMDMVSMYIEIDFKMATTQYVDEKIAKANYVKTVNGNVPDENGNVTVSGGSAITEIAYQNLLNFNDADIKNGGLYDTNGNWVANDKYVTSGYIDVSKNKQLFLFSTKTGEKVMKRSYYPIYDKSKKFISIIPGYTDFISIPSNAFYIRVPVNITVYPDFKNLVVMYGDTIPIGFENLYLPYGYNVVKDINSVKEKANPWNNKKWYAYGTSLTDTSTLGKYPKYVEKLSGMIRTNKGIGGGAICANTQIKDAIMNISDGKADADLITLECLANDGSVEFGDVYDTDGTTFLGSLAQCITYLQKNTTAQIVIIMSPQQRRSTSGTEFTPTYKTTGKLSYAEKGEKMKELCLMYGVHFINPNYALGYNRKTDDYYADHIHHTELGGKVFGEYIWSKLKNIPTWDIN